MCILYDSSIYLVIVLELNKKFLTQPFKFHPYELNTQVKPLYTISVKVVKTNSSHVAFL